SLRPPSRLEKYASALPTVSTLSLRRGSRMEVRATSALLYYNFEGLPWVGWMDSKSYTPYSQESQDCAGGLHRYKEVAS
ncbi:MAG: hypothetical protein Q7V14_05430, partial [Coriobacteriia bacterium]|nr:hypothetical protein [Coriobacteriia bacterium]